MSTPFVKTEDVYSHEASNVYFRSQSNTPDWLAGRMRDVCLITTLNAGDAQMGVVRHNQELVVKDNGGGQKHTAVCRSQIEVALFAYSALNDETAKPLEIQHVICPIDMNGAPNANGETVTCKLSDLFQLERMQTWALISHGKSGGGVELYRRGDQGTPVKLGSSIFLLSNKSDLGEISLADVYNLDRIPGRNAYRLKLFVGASHALPRGGKKAQRNQQRLLIRNQQYQQYQQFSANPRRSARLDPSATGANLVALEFSDSAPYAHFQGSSIEQGQASNPNPFKLLGGMSGWEVPETPFPMVARYGPQANWNMHDKRGVVSLDQCISMSDEEF